MRRVRIKSSMSDNFSGENTATPPLPGGTRKSAWVRFATAMICMVTATAASWAYEIRGSVTDDAGEPLVGASIRLLAAKDSTRVGAVGADDNGRFALKDVRNGRYIVEASYVGSTTVYENVTVKDANVRLKPLVLTESATTLREAVVTGIRTPVKVMGDTVEFAAATYKTQPNAVVEDLLKRLPGVEVASDGKITANGKSVSKILVDGKEFFSDDPTVASRNLPVDMVDKLQVVDRKSDLARLTGVDDGEEETVINLTVKPGMKNGYFGTAEAGYGTDDRYLGSFNVNKFWNDNQITLLGGLNNINQAGFTDSSGNRFRRFGGDNGLKLTQALGLNFNVGNKEIFRVGGNVMYDHSSIRTNTSQERQYNFADSASYVSNRKYAHDKGHNIRADFRVQWNPDSFNTLEFRPRITYSVNDSWANDSSLTRSGRLEDVTRSINRTTSHGTSWNASGQIIYSHKFRNRPGRSFSIHGRYEMTNTREREDSYSWNRFYLINDSTDLYDQIADNHTWNNSVNARVSWTEPLGNPRKGNFLEFAYRISYRWNNADKMIYDHPVTWPDGWDGLPVIGTDSVWRSDLSNQYRNDYMNQDIRAGYKHVSSKGNLNVGISLVPQKSKSIDLIDAQRNITRNVLNFAPYLRYRLRFSQQRSMMINYMGRSSQPSMNQLQPVADYSDPLRVIIGNPELDPTFTHQFNFRFNDFNPEAQRSFMAMVSAQVTQNAITSRTTYNPTTGGQVTTYENINGQWNMMAMGMMSMPFKNRSWVFNAHMFLRYSHNVGFNNNLRNLSQSYNINFMPSIAFRPENLELEVRPRYSVQLSRNSVGGNNTTVQTYGGIFNGTWYSPIGVILSTDLDYQRNSGYAAGYNTNQCLWNATLSYRFLPDKSLTLSLKGYDLLQQKKSVRHNVTAQYTDDTMYNTLTRYFMLTVSYRFNTFGKGNQPADRNRPRWGGGPGRGPR